VNCSFKEAEDSLCYCDKRHVLLAEHGGQGQSSPALWVRWKGHQRHHVGGPGHCRGGPPHRGFYVLAETLATVIDNKEIIHTQEGTGI